MQMNPTCAPPPLPSSQDIPLVTRPRPAVIPPHGAVVLESRHAPHFSGELCDDYAKFHLIIAGRAEWERGGSTCVVSPGTLVFISANVLHRQRDLLGEAVTLYFIHVRPDLLPATTYATLTQSGMLPIDLHAHPISVLHQIRGLFQQMIFEQDAQRPGWEALVAARVLDLAALTIQLSQRTSTALTGAAAPTIVDSDGDSAARVAAYARRQESQFFRQESLEEAASAVHLGRRRFTELFRAVTGETWNQRLLRLRLDHAERLLCTSERSVTAIAFECGFDDISHFNHSFKRRSTCAPLTYRAQHRPIPQA
jgi:AraC-like DNA-binding protein